MLCGSPSVAVPARINASLIRRYELAASNRRVSPIPAIQHEDVRSVRVIGQERLENERDG